MADSRKLALAHEARLRTEGMERLRAHVAQVLAGGPDASIVGELQEQQQKLGRLVVSSTSVRRTLETSRKIRGPSFEMIDGVTRLVGEVAETVEANPEGPALLEAVRQKVVQFTTHLQYTESLVK
jgi:hypothetical protein